VSRSQKIAALLTGLAALVLLVWLGLPSLLRVAGLHPHHDIPPFDAFSASSGISSRVRSVSNRGRRR